MNDEILPMTKSEIAKLDLVVAGLKKKYRTDIENRMMNDGFATAAILNYDNDVVMVEVRYGVSISIPELCFKEVVRIDRHGMEPIEPKDFYA